MFRDKVNTATVTLTLDETAHLLFSSLPHPALELTKNENSSYVIDQ